MAACDVNELPETATFQDIIFSSFPNTESLFGSQ
jgi:hypothetical protein